MACEIKTCVRHLWAHGTQSIFSLIVPEALKITRGIVILYKISIKRRWSLSCIESTKINGESISRTSTVIQKLYRVVLILIALERLVTQRHECDIYSRVMRLNRHLDQSNLRLCRSLCEEYVKRCAVSAEMHMANTIVILNNLQDKWGCRRTNSILSWKRSMRG